MKQLKVAQIGFGAWGPNLTRAFNKVNNCDLSLIIDNDSNRIQKISEEYPSCQFDQDWKAALCDSIDAVIISTPAATHYQIVKEALQAGKHVFVEKPLTTNYEEAVELTLLAQEKKLQLMVGHVFLFHDALNYIENSMHSIGDLLYFSSSRQNFGKIRDDVNAWWNLAPHDISMMLHLKKGEMPTSINVQAHNFFHEKQEDFARATLQWDDKTIGQIDVSWYHPERTRKFIVAGTKKMIVFDDTEKENKIHIYPRSIQKNNQQYIYLSQSDKIPSLEIREPLQIEAAHFVDCILNDKECLTGGKHACDIVNILEAGSKSIKQKGKPIEIFSQLLENSSC
ncbi:MAG: Inositol 2-dehydrogenase/D-chiro-inositol 3-dehydrogenase [Chlamydiae bacterium]|nr:Inositol 2-dehydrogenase/D-chiro-inositol 3-dehydrogenase [Chlamydiota bacterium]